jgi:hypothetical protein
MALRGLGLGSHSVGDWSWPPLISRNKLHQRQAVPLFLAKACACQDHTTVIYIQELFVNIPSETDSVFTRVGTSTKSF